MSDKKNIINLDELLGTPDLFVQWEGEKHPLKKSDQLTPEEVMTVMDLGERFTKANKKDGASLPKTAVAAVDEMLKLLCPTLLEKNIPFTARVMVLEFWKENEEQLKKMAAKNGQPS